MKAGTLPLEYAYAETVRAEAFWVPSTLSMRTTRMDNLNAIRVEKVTPVVKRHNFPPVKYEPGNSFCYHPT